MTYEQSVQLIGHKFKYCDGSIWEVVAVTNDPDEGETVICMGNPARPERRINPRTLADDYSAVKK